MEMWGWRDQIASPDAGQFPCRMLHIVCSTLDQKRRTVESAGMPSEQPAPSMNAGLWSPRNSRAGKRGFMGIPNVAGESEFQRSKRRVVSRNTHGLKHH